MRKNSCLNNTLIPIFWPSSIIKRGKSVPMCGNTRNRKFSESLPELLSTISLWLVLVTYDIRKPTVVELMWSGRWPVVSKVTSIIWHSMQTWVRPQLGRTIVTVIDDWSTCSKFYGTCVMNIEMSLQQMLQSFVYYCIIIRYWK